GGPRAYRYTPLWPMEKRPGWGKYVNPWASRPVLIVLMTWPVSVSTTETEAWKRLLTHSCFPSGETWIMSGLPPTRHVARTCLVAKSITEIVPAIRLLTYSDLASRLTPSP